MANISPTLLCADQLHLGDAIEKLNEYDIAWYHVDVMDGRFVPNLAFGLLSLQSICRKAAHPVCGHFMVENPRDYVKVCKEMGLDYFVFHIEAERNPFRLVEMIRKAGMKPGIAINPITPIEGLEALLEMVDVVLVMAVEPGFSGQKFLEFTYEKIKRLSELKKEKQFIIEVDGGVTPENISRCCECGADVLVAGAFTLFLSGDTLENNYRKLRELI